MESRTVITPDDAAKLAETITGLPLPFTLTWRPGKSRSISQNALIHKWFREIANHVGTTLEDVKGECHLAYGVPICGSDPQWLWVWEQVSAGLTYEEKKRVIAIDIIPVTSRMKAAELSEYMDAVDRDYSAQGVKLTRPEE